MTSDRQLERHLGQTDYDDLATALHHAERVTLDLEDQLAGQVVVPVDEIEFLTRRLRSLVRACRDALPVDERVIPS